jgi:hypothetical protein
MSSKTSSKRASVITGTDVLAAMQSTNAAETFLAERKESRARKPFAVGARVARKSDGVRGTVESVELYGVEGQPRWAVAVRTDDDGAVWSGTQDTAAKGAWVKLTAAQLATDELDSDAHPWNDFARASADYDARTAVENAEPTHNHAADCDCDTCASAAVEKLTDAGRAFMYAVGAQHFDFFDEGINEGSGNWGEGMSWQFAKMTDRKPRSVSGVMSRLSTSGLWNVSDAGDGDGNWWSLTALGAAVARKLASDARTAELRSPERIAEALSVPEISAAAAERKSAQELLRAAESELDAAAQQKHEKRARWNAERAARVSCDWYGCSGTASATRVLAAQTWNVCSAHA